MSHDDALEVVRSLAGEFNGLFGVEKDQGLDSALGAIYQTFGGDDLYPSIEEKGANLLYLVTKNHAFVDGNKRIAAAIFLTSWPATAASTAPTAPSAWPTTPLSP